jgi:hypothetical protein
MEEWKNGIINLSWTDLGAPLRGLIFSHSPVLEGGAEVQDGILRQRAAAPPLGGGRGGNSRQILDAG